MAAWIKDREEHNWKRIPQARSAVTVHNPEVILVEDYRRERRSPFLISGKRTWAVIG
jgi:hypothetical protein